MIARSLVFCFIVLLVLGLLNGLVVFIMALAEDGTGLDRISVVLPLTIVLTMSGALIASVMYYRRLPRESEAVNLSPREVQVLAFSIIGMFLLATGLSGVVFVLIQMVRVTRAGAFEGVGEIVAHVLQQADSLVSFFLGLCLFFGAKGFSRFWFVIRGQDAQ